MKMEIIDLTEERLIQQDEADLIEGQREWHEYCIEEGLEEESEDCTYQPSEEFDEDEFSED